MMSKLTMTVVTVAKSDSKIYEKVKDLKSRISSITTVQEANIALQLVTELEAMVNAHVPSKLWEVTLNQLEYAKQGLERLRWMLEEDFA